MFTSVDEPFLFTSCIKFGLLVMPFLIMEYNIINYFRFVKCFDKLFLKINYTKTSHLWQTIELHLYTQRHHQTFYEDILHGQVDCHHLKFQLQQPVSEKLYK